MAKTKISCAPTVVNLSITVAIFFFSTIELTATQPSSSKALTVAARLPGVISTALPRSDRFTLYWQSTYFCAAGIQCQSCDGRSTGYKRSPMTPLIRDAIRSTRSGLHGFFDLMRIAVLSTTVAIAFNPAALMVSPDSDKEESINKAAWNSQMAHTYRLDPRLHPRRQEHKPSRHYH